MTNGADQVHVTSTSRSQVLSHLSAIQPIPHLFLIDRDQRTATEMEKLQRNVDGQLYVLKRRELENELLVPRDLLAALKDGRVPWAHLRLGKGGQTAVDEPLEPFIAVAVIGETPLLANQKVRQLSCAARRRTRCTP